MSRRSLAVRHAVPLAALLAALFAGCRGSGPAGEAERPKGRVVVLGLDGLDPDAVDLLAEEGKLPSFARLKRDGAYGRLRSMKPMLSPVLWTTVATGKPPEEHRIGHFVAIDPATERQLPVTSRMRAVEALWNILSEAGRTVGVVGWWATWPAEHVRGAIVSDHTCYHFLLNEDHSGEPGAGVGQTWPAELAAEIAPLIERPGEVTAADLAPFAALSAADLERPFDFHDDLSQLRWAWATAESYRRIGGRLWQELDPDLLLVYIEAPDTIQHLFGHLFRSGPLEGELEQQRRRYGRAVEAVYAYADRVVGEYLGRLAASDTLVVLSDHGFALGRLPEDPSKTRDMRRVSERYHREEGVLYAYGRGVVPGGRFDKPTLLDLAPTLLALSGLPAARDMPGRVLTEALSMDPPERTVASYESGERKGTAGMVPAVDPAIVEHLESLGYLGSSSPRQGETGVVSPPAEARLAVSPRGEENLAGILFESGRHQEAVRAYRELLERDPRDGALWASLAGALGALGRYQEALEALDRAVRLDPLNPEAYHNRGAVYERLGKPEEAAAQYREALRYSPQYEPSRRALVRLVGPERAFPTLTGDAGRAAELAELASGDARRGDYRKAMGRLDQAERLAPGLALVHHYRANVAYLMGDREGAIAALRRALAIEPDNALFRANLERLEAEGAAGTEAPGPGASGARGPGGAGGVQDR